MRCSKWPWRNGSTAIVGCSGSCGSAGTAVNAKRVLRLMREDNLLCLRTRRFVPATTDSRHGWRVWPNLARGLVTRNLNELWVADITYVRLQEEFVYVAVVLDAHSRRVIGWAVAGHLGASVALEACAWRWPNANLRRA